MLSFAISKSDFKNFQNGKTVQVKINGEPETLSLTIGNPNTVSYGTTVKEVQEIVEANGLIAFTCIDVGAPKIKIFR